MASSAELNALMRLLEFLFSQEAAMITNTADPISVAMQEIGEDVGTPLTDSLMNSSNDKIKRVFIDMAEGTIDPVTAKQRLYAENPDLETSWINNAVDDSFAEITASTTGGTGGSGSSKKKTKYEEGFLPSPTESYLDRPELAPLLPKAAEALAPVEKTISMARTAKESGTAPTRSLKDVVNRVGAPSKSVDYFAGIEDEGLKSRINAMPKSAQLKLYTDFQRKRKEQEVVKKDIMQKNAASLAAAGRNPLQDALLKRITALGGLK